MLMELLSEQPYRFSIAFNGYQGYQLALATLPDLILLDVRMPEMDGYTACRLLKANPETEQIPVIFLSGADAAKERIMACRWAVSTTFRSRSRRKNWPRAFISTWG